jgi:uncharacterized protein
VNNTSAAPAARFHAGELAVQHRAGVRAAAERLSAMLDTPDLRGSIGRFLTDRSFTAITGRDRAGRLWISSLTGPPGLLEVTGSTSVRVHATPAAGDPLHGLPAGQPVGLLAIEFARRRRVRVNGLLAAAGDDGLTVQVDQAYGNCPQYIQQRILRPAGPAVPGDVVVRNAHVLSPVDVDLIRSADTFLLGTTHPDHGSDASHRGGPPGFVHVEDDRSLWWPDYPGNNMFNSLGNLAVDPAAALLFIDFTTGRTLHLSGAAQLDWASTDAGDDDQTGRRVRFERPTSMPTRTTLRSPIHQRPGGYEHPTLRPADVPAQHARTYSQTASR